jgi:hypothetical protein
MTMSLETSIALLRRELSRLLDAISALRVTVVEDRPARAAVVLVDQLDNLVTDLSSALEEADALAARTQEISQPQAMLEELRGAVHEMHALINRSIACYVGELAAHDRIAQLLEMGDERGHGWWEWSQEVKTAIERCAPPLNAVMNALLDAWSELAERLARSSVSVQATNIGQQITLREDQLELSGRVP